MLRKLYATLLLIPLLASSSYAAGDFETFLKPLFSKSCVSCHGQPRPGKTPKVKGKVNLFDVKTEQEFLAQPKMIKEMIEAIDANDMPPEDEPQFDAATKKRVIASLKSYLVFAAKNEKTAQVKIHRLNRFQYNYAVKDLFKLKKDIFNLPEKLMTRKTGPQNYLNNVKSGKMPAKVNVTNKSFDKRLPFQGVEPFPQDTRASHGFDNQADNLTLSPLLLDAFLKLSISIIQSPDFNSRNVGVWNELFAEPNNKTGINAEIKKRLRKHLTMAFRRPVDEEVLNGYTSYTINKMKSGLSFTDSMKKAVTASLSSPLFIYKHRANTSAENEYYLASKLSFMLWGSIPDEELLTLAEQGKLSKNLKTTVERMMLDPKVERFLDTFPAQWMQLNGLLDAQPNTKDFELFWADKFRPASTQMVLEPLLLFDTVYMENRPVSELIKPNFSYRSKFLDKWYDLNNYKLTPQQIAEDKAIAKKRRELEHARNIARDFVNKRRDKAKRLIQVDIKKKFGKVRFTNVKPHSSWDFNGNLNDELNRIDLKAHGKISFKNGMLVLNNAYLTGDARDHFRERTYEIRFKLNSINQKGGGLIGIQGTDQKNITYDSLVFSKTQDKQWLSDSNQGKRTQAFKGSPEINPGEMIHLAISYGKNGEVEMFRNGKLYGKKYKAVNTQDYHRGKGLFFVGISDLIGKGKTLSVSIDRLRIYRRHLSGRDLKALSLGANHHLSTNDIVAKLNPEDAATFPAKEKELQNLEEQLRKLPPNDHRMIKLKDTLRRDLRSQEFVRGQVNDPRYGGIITNAALMTMTSTSKRSKPIARGAWMIEVIFNDPPPPPPNNVPALDEENSTKKLTIREAFAKHRDNPDCAGCHAKLDPLGFVMENFNPIGLWRDKYKKNNRPVDPHGTLLRKHDYKDIVEFKDALIKEEKRFAKAFAAHLLRFAQSRKLSPGDALTVEKIVNRAEKDKFRLQSLIKEVILSESFLEM